MPEFSPRLTIDHLRDAVQYERNAAVERARKILRGDHIDPVALPEFRNAAVLDALFRDDALLELLAKRLRQVLAGVVKS